MDKDLSTIRRSLQMRWTSRQHNKTSAVVALGAASQPSKRAHSMIRTLWSMTATIGCWYVHVHSLSPTEMAVFFYKSQCR